MLDQGLHSVVTLLLTAVAARIASVQDFATFSVGLAIYYTGITVARSLTTGAILVVFGGDAKAVRRSRKSVLALSTTAATLISGAVFATYYYGDNLAITLTLAAAVIPQVWLDTERYMAISEGRNGLAVGIAATYLLSFLVGLATLVALNVIALATVVLAWGSSALIAATAARFLTEPADVAYNLRDYLRRMRPAMSALSVEAVSLALATQLIVVILGILASAREVAGYRLVVSLVLGPLTTMLMGVLPQIQVRLRQWVGAGEPTSLTRIQLIGVSITTVTVGASGLAALVPDSMWTTIMGASAPAAQDMLWPATAVVAATSAGGIWWMWLRYVLGLRPSATLRTVSTFALLVVLYFLTSLAGPSVALLVYAFGLLSVPLLVTSAKSNVRPRVL